MSISSGSPKENKAAQLWFRYSNYVTKPRYTHTCRHDIACTNSMWASKVLRSLEDLWSLINSTNLHAQESDFVLSVRHFRSYLVDFTNTWYTIINTIFSNLFFLSNKYLQ